MMLATGCHLTQYTRVSKNSYDVACIIRQAPDRGSLLALISTNTATKVKAVVVGWFMLKRVESSVESAWFLRMKL
jgi:hypothetical protein